MNVVPAYTRPQLLPNLDGAQSPREQKQDGESFGEVLAAAMRAEPGVHPDGTGSGPAPEAPDAGIELAAPTQGRPELELGAPVVEIQVSAAIDYRRALEDGKPVAIGEDAVRFDARPVVGRAFVGGVPAEVVSPQDPEPAQLTPANTEPPALDPELWRAIAMAAPRIEAMVSGPVAWRVMAPAPAGRPAGPAKGAVARPVEPLAPARANRWVAPERSAAPAPSPDAGKSEIRTDISLTLLADEVLVTVRGLDLSAEEEEALVDEARRLLASSDFGGRALRVMTSRRA